MTKTLLAMSALAVIAFLTAISPDSALAQTSDLGRNLGNEIKAWATALLLGVAALVSIPVLAKREVNGGLTLAFLVLVLGGFAFAQGTVRQVIIEVWRSLQ